MVQSVQEVWGFVILVNAPACVSLVVYGLRVHIRVSAMEAGGGGLGSSGVELCVAGARGVCQIDGRVGRDRVRYEGGSAAADGVGDGVAGLVHGGRTRVGNGVGVRVVGVVRYTAGYAVGSASGEQRYVVEGGLRDCGV